jgi:hypothetical protein
MASASAILGALWFGGAAKRTSLVVNRPGGLRDLPRCHAESRLIRLNGLWSVRRTLHLKAREPMRKTLLKILRKTPLKGSHVAGRRSSLKMLPRVLRRPSLWASPWARRGTSQRASRWMWVRMRHGTSQMTRQRTSPRIQQRSSERSSRRLSQKPSRRVSRKGSRYALGDGGGASGK